MDSDELSTCGNNLQKIPEGLLQDWMKNLPEQVTEFGTSLEYKVKGNESKRKK